MGAIAALLSRKEVASAEQARRMLSVAPHRGASFDVLACGRAVLATSNAESFPDATSAAGHGMAAVFQGVLDNQDELVDRFLNITGAVATTPAEVILALFRRLGEGAPNLLRGMFAAVVTDGTRLWCFRDHLAFGQLFYRSDPRMFVAATEIKQVVAGAGIPFEPNLEVVERMFYSDVDDQMPTAITGVDRMPKSVLLVADEGAVKQSRYWDPSDMLETARFSQDEIQSRFDALMAQAVGRMLTGEDVISLSGGVDSPALAAFAAPQHEARYGRPIAALSEIYPDFPSVDESKYIRIMCERFGIESHTFNPESRPLDDILEWTRLCDSPVPVHPPAEAAEFYSLASKLGYRTILGGDLAEFVIDRRGGVMAHLVARRRFSSVRDLAKAQLNAGGSWPGIARQIVSAFTPRSYRVIRERLQPTPALFPDWLDMRPLRRINARFVLSAREQWSKEQAAFFVGPGFALEADDVIGAVYGVRPRRPWIDIDLCEFFLSLPAEAKYPDTKRKTFAKRLLRGRVPDEILDRTDRTFFNDRLMGRIDYPALRHWLINPAYRISGVDYDLLADRIEREDLSHIGHYKWATDLAKTHAFLSLW